jgi:hypothetical protein
VAEHGRLQIPLIDATPQEHTEQAAEEPVAQWQEHLASLKAGRSTRQRRGQSAD